MFAEISAKARDAAQMFWQALDDEEKRIVAYLACYVIANIALAVHSSSRSRRERALEARIAERLTQETRVAPETV